MKIIKVTSQHASLLKALGSETFTDSHRGSAPMHEIESYLAEKYSVHYLEKELNNPKNIYHLFEYENEVVGYSKLMFNTPHKSIAKKRVTKLDQIYLKESCHGRKLGAEILKFSIDLSKTNRDEGMWLVVWIGNETAIQFYRKFGFQVVEDGYFQLTATHQSRYHLMFLDYLSKDTNHKFLALNPLDWFKS